MPKKYCIVDRALTEFDELEEGWIVEDGVVCMYVTEEEFKESLDFQIECVWYSEDCDEYSSIDELRSDVYEDLYNKKYIDSVNGFAYYIEEVDE